MAKPALSEEMYLDQRMIQLKDLLSVETITNDNGTAIKFSDGTLICRGRGSVPSLSGGGTYVEISLPHKFVDDDYDVTYGFFNGNSYWSFLAVQTEGKTTNGFNIRIWSNTSSTSAPAEISYIAIGRWK